MKCEIERMEINYTFYFFAFLKKVIKKLLTFYYWRCEMDYMTLKEAAEKWSVSPRRVNYYCAGGRIPSAVKMAGVWLIPKTAEKPIDGRTKQGKEQKHE